MDGKLTYIPNRKDRYYQKISKYVETELLPNYWSNDGPPSPSCPRDGNLKTQTETDVGGSKMDGPENGGS